MRTPIQIVMTPTRNEAWIIRAFLDCNSLWADYIIVADQMSTDGTREIIAEYQNEWNSINTKTSNSDKHQCHLIMIDNTNPEFNEAERQGMLVAKAREISAGRDTLLWGLDADEILPSNWQNTGDGRHILNSKKGDVFWFRWANISPDKRHYGEGSYQPWLFHDDGIEPHGNYVRNIHSMRIPYPIEEKQMYYVKDFRVLHFGFISPMRTAAKNRFYQVVDWTLNKRNPISLSRTCYAHRIKNQKYDMPYILEQDSISFPFDLWPLINIDARHTWFDDYIYEHLSAFPIEEMRKLDIWDDDILLHYQLSDKRRWIDRMVHGYLHTTCKCRNTLIVRAIDYVLKRVY